MPIAYVHYDLQDGYIHNWLSGGPQAIPVNNTNKEQIFQNHFAPATGIDKTPVEQGKLGDGDFQVGDYTGTWVYTRCQEDHFVQHSRSFASPHFLRSWAYTQLTSKEVQKVSLVLTAFGPADLWVNGEHLHRQEYSQGQSPSLNAPLSRRERGAFVPKRRGEGSSCAPNTVQIPSHVSIPATLQAGGNEVLVRFESVALPEGNHALALRVCKKQANKSTKKTQPAANVRLRLPSTIRHPERRTFLENLFEAAYLDRDLFGPQDPIYVRWPDDWNIKDDLTVLLKSLDGWTYGEANLTTQPAERVFLGYSNRVAEGPYRILFTPKPDELYKDNTRIQREIPIYCAGLCLTSPVPYGTADERRQEALAFAARQADTLFAEIVKMEMERWSMVQPAVISQAAAEVNERRAGSPLKLLGLLGMLHRFGGQPEFPEALKPELEACVLGFSYQPVEEEQELLGFPSEGEQILLSACQILAGQLYPKKTFQQGGKKGPWQRQQGEKAALAWMQHRAESGFETWNSPETLEQSLAALAHLVDLAEAEPVWELAAALMDKILFSLALHSFQGVLGAPHAGAKDRFIRLGALQPTSGVTRLLWGTGSYNHSLAGMVSLALAKNYELPPVLAEIATAPPEETWSQERHVVPAGEANLVAYKTPDFLLASAQDYRPGEKGSCEHLWQATLGKSAVVFTNHPANSGTAGSPAPGFWLGNATLPRLAQWKDALLAIYNLQDDDWMGFTHAYFPTHAFDEYALRGGWAFARQGDGFLALTASGGFQLVRQGTGAYCELRSPARQNIWLSQMGRAAQDGDFNSFQEKVLASEIIFTDLTVQYKTLRGETLAFGWHAPLQRDGKEVPLTGFQHYHNPYTVADIPCKGMEIRFKDDILRLDFAGLS
jgi:hypothetical protein